MNLGYPINPARDLGPRLFAFFIYDITTTTSGYRLSRRSFGAALAAWSYHLFIGAHIPDPVQEYVLDEVKQPLKSANDA
ncbi:hypothetical protein OSTOST_22014 [Ostertagia ostertagi]